MEKLLNSFTKHPIRCIIIAFLALSIVPPFVVHCLYKIPAFIPFFVYIIPAGNVLAYLGTVMTFCATFSLSMLVYIQNRNSIEKAELLENRTFISINNGNDVEMSTPSAKNEMSLMFDTKINVLSETRFSKIDLKFISIQDETMFGCKEKFSMNFHTVNQSVFFQYLNKNEVKISFGILKVEDSVMNILEKIERPTVGMDIDFICGNVITPITITLILQKDSVKSEGIDFIYNISEVFIHHHREQFLK